MSDSPSAERELPPGSREERMSALFANLVIQQTNLALMLLGQVPHPESGERVQDLDGARILIDQLEMIEAKTKGNLDKREDQLLKQSLTALRLAFVESIESAPRASAASSAGITPSATPAAASAPTASSGSTPPEAGPDESRKKFSKKY